MDKTIFIDGHAAITINETKRVINAQFLPDDQGAFILEESDTTRGKMQLFRNGSMDYVACKPRRRANSTLLHKVAHGRLSATKDGATQLTLKSFKVEAINWPRAFVCETVDMMTDVMGTKKMVALLSELLNGLKEGKHGS